MRCKVRFDTLANGVPGDWVDRLLWLWGEMDPPPQGYAGSETIFDVWQRMSGSAFLARHARKLATAERDEVLYALYEEGWVTAMDRAGLFGRALLRVVQIEEDQTGAEAKEDARPAYDVNLENGKYRLLLDEQGFRALRYGEPWRDLTGDKMVLCLVQEIERLREYNAKLTQMLKGTYRA